MKLSYIIQTLKEVQDDLGNIDVEVYIEENINGEKVLCIDEIEEKE
jgi:hypothetical protein